MCKLFISLLYLFLQNTYVSYLLLFVYSFWLIFLGGGGRFTHGNLFNSQQSHWQDLLLVRSDPYIHMAMTGEYSILDSLFIEFFNGVGWQTRIACSIDTLLQVTLCENEWAKCLKTKSKEDLLFICSDHTFTSVPGRISKSNP